MKTKERQEYHQQCSQIIMKRLRYALFQIFNESKNIRHLLKNKYRRKLWSTNIQTLSKDISPKNIEVMITIIISLLSPMVTSHKGLVFNETRRNLLVHCCRTLPVPVDRTADSWHGPSRLKEWLLESPVTLPNPTSGIHWAQPEAAWRQIKELRPHSTTDLTPDHWPHSTTYLTWPLTSN